MANLPFGLPHTVGTYSCTTTRAREMPLLGASLDTLQLQIPADFRGSADFRILRKITRGAPSDRQLRVQLVGFAMVQLHWMGNGGNALHRRLRPFLIIRVGTVCRLRGYPARRYVLRNPG